MRPAASSRPDPFRAWRFKAHELLEEGSDNSSLSRAIDVGLTVLIVANVVAAIAETEPEMGARYQGWFAAFELFSVAIFTVEYALRVWCSTAEPQLARLGPLRGRLAFMSRPFAIIDLLAILPYYLSSLLGVDLRVLRVLRLIRVLKLARYSPALSTLGHVLSRERHALLAALILMICLLTVSGAVMHHLERAAQPEKFGSIAAAMWWALATLTTVGYGDLAPVTPAGRVFGGIVMICGLGLFAVPIAVIASGFQDEIRRREFVVTWGMVARVPVFSEVTAADIAEILRLLTARRYRGGERIVSPGEPADAMYFIVTGEVRMTEDGETDDLAAGDFFGESALGEDGVRLQSARALNEVHLLVLERADLRRLAEERPEMRRAIDEGRRARRAAAAARAERAGSG